MEFFFGFDAICYNECHDLITIINLLKKEMNLIAPLVKACLFALEHNLNLQADEKVLIVADDEKRIIGDAFKEAALALSSHVKMRTIPVLDYSGQEPPPEVVDEMRFADVILLPLAKSLSWTKARRMATEGGARIASMPGIRPETVLRTFPQDYGRIKERVNRLCDLLDETKSVQVKTELGTDLTFDINGRRGRGRKGGIYTAKGAWGNLPCGEAFIAPVERTAHGLYLVDASHSGLGEIGEPVRIEVQGGRAVSISGGLQSSLLLEILKRSSHPDAFNIAEFGIGCNDKAEVCGVTLEDEKALGTCHIALGGNAYFGGRTDAGIHLDGVLRGPTVKFDGHIIMRHGKLLI
jgi:leucyl aminopeptidase (aminopeptidase T)